MRLGGLAVLRGAGALAAAGALCVTLGTLALHGLAASAFDLGLLLGLLLGLCLGHLCGLGIYLSGDLRAQFRHDRLANLFDVRIG